VTIPRGELQGEGPSGLGSQVWDEVWGTGELRPLLTLPWA
jgi:hypothetical protein